MNPPLAKMLAADAVSRRDEQLHATASVPVEARHRRVAPITIAVPRRWAGRALRCSGRALIRTGVRIGGDGASAIAAHG